MLKDCSIEDIFNIINEKRFLNICYNRDIDGICAGSIMIDIMKKNMIKYEIKAETMDETVGGLISDGENKYRIQRKSIEGCRCPRRYCTLAYPSYRTAKKMGIFRRETLWAMAISFAYHTELEIPNKMGIECNVCKDINEELVSDIRLLEDVKEGISYTNRPRLLFLETSELISCIKNDIKWVFENSLFSNNPKAGEKKIFGVLAQKGISINNGNSRYKTLLKSLKERALDAFGMYKTFMIQKGSAAALSALEYVFLICFYIYKDKDVFSILCIRKKRLVLPEKACLFYQKVIYMMKDGICKQQKTREMILFRTKSEGNEKTLLPVVRFLYFLYFEYILRKKEVGLKIIIAIETSEDKIVIYSRDYDFENIKRETRKKESIAFLDGIDALNVLKSIVEIENQ